MKKYFVFISLCILILGITITFGIYEKDNNSKILKETNKYNNEIEKLENDNREIREENDLLSKDNASKLEEYEKWKKRTEEIEEKIEEE